MLGSRMALYKGQAGILKRELLHRRQAKIAWFVATFPVHCVFESGMHCPEIFRMYHENSDREIEKFIIRHPPKRGKRWL
jgi:hypothetical protein